jgi:hypothetical protein
VFLHLHTQPHIHTQYMWGAWKICCCSICATVIAYTSSGILYDGISVFVLFQKADFCLRHESLCTCTHSHIDIHSTCVSHGKYVAVAFMQLLLYIHHLAYCMMRYPCLFHTKRPREALVVCITLHLYILSHLHTQYMITLR